MFVRCRWSPWSNKNMKKSPSYCDARWRRLMMIMTVSHKDQVDSRNYKHTLYIFFHMDHKRSLLGEENISGVIELMLPSWWGYLWLWLFYVYECAFGYSLTALLEGMAIVKEKYVTWTTSPTIYYDASKSWVDDWFSWGPLIHVSFLFFFLKYQIWLQVDYNTSI